VRIVLPNDPDAPGFLGVCVLGGPPPLLNLLQLKITTSLQSGLEFYSFRVRGRKRIRSAHSQFFTFSLHLVDEFVCLRDQFEARQFPQFRIA
jgi:hypothetical protein